MSQDDQQPITVPNMCATHQVLLVGQCGYSPQDPWRALVIATQIALFQGAAADPKVHAEIGGDISKISRVGCLACRKPDLFGTLIHSVQEAPQGVAHRGHQGPGRTVGCACRAIGALAGQYFRAQLLYNSPAYQRNPTTRKEVPMAKAPKTMQRHPLSEMFSLPMSGEERSALRAHIKENTQLHPILVYEGMVLDGWERYTGCLEVGVKPELKEYTGPNPASAAFGANVLRRRLSSVQKALMGARFLIQQQEAGAAVTQKGVAATVCVSLKRLNEMVQLCRAADGNEKAAKALAQISGTPEIAPAIVSSLLADAGIIDTSVKPPKGDTGDDDFDGDSDAGVDLLGGDDDIDEMLGEAGLDAKPKRREIGDETPASLVGTGRSNPAKRPTETPASMLSKQYRALTEPERRDFVRFAWSVLRTDIEALAAEGRIDMPAIGAERDVGKSTMSDITRALAAATTTGEAPAKGRKGRKPATDAAI